jgi:hypothetical protein
MKLVVLHDSVEKETELLNSFQNDCTLRWAKDYDTIEKLLDSINNLSNYTYLAYVYHYPGYCSLPFYGKQKQLSEDKPELILSKYNYFNDNLINLMKNFKTVDILSCNLNEPVFMEEVKKIEGELNIDIRYSLNQTGNDPNSDWILESDNIDVKQTYFTDLINEWNGNLGTNETVTARISLLRFRKVGDNYSTIYTSTFNNTSFNDLNACGSLGRHTAKSFFFNKTFLIVLDKTFFL